MRKDVMTLFVWLTALSVGCDGREDGVRDLDPPAGETNQLIQDLRAWVEDQTYEDGRVEKGGIRHGFPEGAPKEIEVWHEYDDPSRGKLAIAAAWFGDEERFEAVRFWVFKGTDVGFQYIGHADEFIALSRHYRPQWAIEPYNGKPRWLVVRGGGGAGTGLYVQYEEWFDIGGERVIESLRLTEGYDANTDVMVAGTIGSRVIATIADEPAVIIHMSKELESETKSLSRKDGISVFVHDPATGRLFLDENRSDWSNQELERFWCSRILNVATSSHIAE